MRHYHCPVNGWDCPYYKDEPNHPCVCTIEGDPFYECDDFASLWDKEDEYWDDHEWTNVHSGPGALLKN
jgi:hypothetical protein